MSIKLKTILTTTMLIASLSASCLPAAAVSTASETSEEAVGIVLDSDADAAELACLRSVNGGTLPRLTYDENNTVTHIDGQISDKTVRSERDAIAVIESIQNLLGMRDAKTELTLLHIDETEDNTAYIFRQVYQGIELENEYITLYVNKATGKADYLNSAFIPDFSINTKPAIPKKQVKDIIKTEFDTDVQGDAKLVIFEQNDRTLKLAYETKTCSAEHPIVFIDAQTGTVLYELNGEAAATYTYSSTTPNPVTGTTSFTVNTDYINGAYRLCDRTRNIWIVNTSNTYNTFDNDATYYRNTLDINTFNGQTILNRLDESRYYGLMSGTYNNNWNSYKIETGTLAQVAKAYDFYKNALNRIGTDNQNGRLYIYPHLNIENSAASFVFNYMMFGDETSNCRPQARDIGIVTHEYTHRVTNTTALWAGSGTVGQNQVFTSYGETSCINEAYSDIMAEYAKMYYGTGSYWKVGTAVNKDGTAMRDITKGDQGPSYLWKGYVYYYRADMPGELCTLESHLGSTIVSYAAYKMDKLGITPAYAREIWYKSINYLRKGRNQATFADCRSAVTRAAQEVFAQKYSNATTRKNMMIKVNSAFNKVHIFQRSNDRLGDINRDGYINNSDVTLATAMARNLANYTDTYQISLADVNFDGRVTTEDAEKILRSITFGEILE